MRSINIWYKRTDGDEKCALITERILFMMRAKEKEVKKDEYGNSYLTGTIEFNIDDGNIEEFYYEETMDHFFDHGEFFDEKSFIYALYCLTGKACGYQELKNAEGNKTELLEQFLKRNYIYDREEGTLKGDEALKESERAFNYLTNKCKFLPPQVAILPAIIELYIKDYVR